jgi:SAM-dependent methyltransferase
MIVVDGGQGGDVRTDEARAAVPFDYESSPERYRLGMRITAAHAGANLYEHLARMLRTLSATVVLDVGCADGVLRRALAPCAIRPIGLDAAAAMLCDHPPPVVRGDALRLPFRDEAFDAVTALNVLYHLPDPQPALREARRVLHPDGHLLATTISRADSPELAAYWRRPATPFDTEDAPAVLARVFAEISVHTWDAPLVTLPDPSAIRDYLLGRQAPRAVADAAARGLAAPLRVTKRGALLVARGHSDPDRAKCGP